MYSFSFCIFDVPIYKVQLDENVSMCSFLKFYCHATFTHYTFTQRRKIAPFLHPAKLGYTHQLEHAHTYCISLCSPSPLTQTSFLMKAHTVFDIYLSSPLSHKNSEPDHDLGSQSQMGQTMCLNTDLMTSLLSSESA